MTPKRPSASFKLDEKVVKQLRVEKHIDILDAVFN